jgi:hypothetical protein
VIGLVLAAALVAPSAPPDVPPLRPRAVAGTRTMPAAAVLARYESALAAQHPPAAITFEYAIEQAGARTLDQTHRVFRSGEDQRDEILTSDGKRLDPPSVRIFRGHRNRYAVESLAPRPALYTFHLIGTVRNGRHDDYVFETSPRVPAAFTVVRIVIDGSSFLPSTIAFVTAAHNGSGTISYVRAANFWVPSVASAHARYENLGATERIVFSRYRFPSSLPPSTFKPPHPLPSAKVPVPE